jgi:repressor LexA
VAALSGNGDYVTDQRLYREKNEAGDRLRLKPENGDHQDLVIPAQDVKIQGRVVYVVHPPRGRR